MKLFRKSDAMLQRPLWQKLVIAAVAVIGDFLVLSVHLSSSEALEDRGVLFFAATIGTWILLPFALRHAARERDPRSTQPGPRSALVAATIISATVSIAEFRPSVFMAAFSAASRRSRLWMAAVCVAMLASELVTLDLSRSEGVSAPGKLGFFSAFILPAVVVLAVGLVRSNQKERTIALQAQAELTHEEMATRENFARQEERDRIARDMHDTLSHRLSMIAVYAGGLAYRQDLDPEETRKSARTIRDEAEAAVGDLREALHSLRSEGRIDPREGVESLVERSRRAGMYVEVRYQQGAGPQSLAELSTMAGHAVNRAVQEGLTNARKHAPGEPVTITIAALADALLITMSNPVAPAEKKRSGNSGGYGIVGMRERASVVGGSLQVKDEEESFSWTLRLPRKEVQ
ncbi:histidine kinase [Corynebacterium sp. MSK105]|uniref:sensor histidine kinase n=1 Tax=unclassified Corynebacterium TaxID=2624378 RepID=UPI00254D5405|nr:MULTISPECIES: histidine kinase [unclassified Corynebacterium]MDK8482318.1 histidine kinase [Corynebacterium sp. MSK074]MDK8689821.1 histidine kinase [Corynebacterium sp. MSK105]